MPESGALYKTPWENFVDIVKLIILALLIMLVIRIFIIEPFYIPSGSMENTLQEGDRVFVSKFSYGMHLPFVGKSVVSYGEPKHGDIVVFPYPENPKVNFIKRVIGLPGDVIEIRNKNVYRNGELLREEYVIHKDAFTRHSVRDFYGPKTVPEGKVFVLGDNRDESRDSRYWDFVDTDTIYGRAFIIYWSGMNFIHVNWSRIGNLI